ncbi:MAG: HAD family hydrolase [Deltaproteobacteria bacterium]|nr:HAD family hydrolase [Deltaproteobacteria bacterium]
MAGNMREYRIRDIPDAMIFDLDGTLIDSIEAYFRIMEITFEEIGVPPVSRERILGAVVDGGFNWKDVLPAGDASQRGTLMEKAWEVINGLYPRIFRDHVNLFPGVGEVVKDLKAGGVKVGIATTTPRKQMEVKLLPLRKSGIAELFDAIITAEDAQRRKPAPDPLLECLRRMDVEPTKSIYIGDTTADIRAGKAAGMGTIGVLSGLDPYEALKREGPDLIIPRVAELRKTEYFPGGG